MTESRKLVLTQYYDSHGCLFHRLGKLWNLLEALRCSNTVPHGTKKLRDS